MKLWKALGLAGLAGVAATGAVIVRDERRRAHLTPEQVRDRLRERVQDLPAESTEGPAAVAAHRSPSAMECVRTLLQDLRARRQR